jgi:hypothetical protein
MLKGAGLPFTSPRPPLSHQTAALKAVEPWLRKRAGRPHAIVRRQFSEAAVDSFRDAQLDFIYVDAGHEYRNVLADCRRWWPKLRAGGMLAGDDFADAADRFFSEPWHSRYNWGVKSAVAQFAVEVRRSMMNGCTSPAASATLSDQTWPTCRLAPRSSSPTPSGLTPLERSTRTPLPSG